MTPVPVLNFPLPSSQAQGLPERALQPPSPPAPFCHLLQPWLLTALRTVALRPRHLLTPPLSTQLPAPEGRPCARHLPQRWECLGSVHKRSVCPSLGSCSSGVTLNKADSQTRPAARHGHVHGRTVLQAGAGSELTQRSHHERAASCGAVTPQVSLGPPTWGCVLGTGDTWTEAGRRREQQAAARASQQCQE